MQNLRVNNIDAVKPSEISNEKISCDDTSQLEVDNKITGLNISKRGEALIGQEMFKILDRAREIEKKGYRVIHLELGNPRQPPPTTVVQSAIDSLKDLCVGYTSPAGLPALREALANRYAAHDAPWVGAGNVVVSPANFIISQFLDLVCDRGDRIVLFTPAFPTYWAAAAYIGLEVVGVPLAADSGYDLTIQDIDIALSAHPRAIIVNSANNPTGAVYKESTLRYLGDRCRDLGIWLLSDETYADICYSTPFFSMSTLGFSNIVVMSSFSKVMSVPGYRVGYAVATQEVVEKLVLSNSTLISCLPIFSQAGCLAGLEVLDEYVRWLRERFSSISTRSAALINQSPTLRAPRPKSGYYLFVDISATGMDDMTFCAKLLEERHTAATPGRSFGAIYKNHVRVAFCGDQRDFEEGVERMIALANDVAYKGAAGVTL